MTVLSPLGQSIRVNKLFKDVPLKVQGEVFPANLMELPFREFDIISGMDWLVKHRVKLDCATKWLVLRTSGDEEVAIIGERRDYLSNVISVLRAEKVVRKGCEAFLAYVSNSGTKSLSVGDARTVKEFTDVFLEELSGLPPDREFEFGIELLPGTAPVSIAPYKMEPEELVQLKAQIQELKANVVAGALSRRVVSDLRVMFACLSLYDDGSVLAELQVKAKHQLPSGLLQQVKIPLWKWERVTMDFVSRLPLTAFKKDSVWVIVDRLTKSPHFIPVRTDYSLQKLAKLYVAKITDGLSERLIQILDDMLRSCVLDFRGSWEDYLLLVEFVYNNSYQFRPKLVADTEDKVKLIREQLKEAFDRQKSYADLKRKEIEYSVGEYVFLKEIEVRPDLTIEEEPVQILERDVKVLRKKSVPLVKVLWRNHGIEEDTREPEETYDIITLIYFDQENVHDIACFDYRWYWGWPKVVILLS
ncbi:uncharacterized protein [Gossypium hirsutum]|uniref:DNA/RNA polymerases superfamily protein n=1 Tax=Gossypium hirsutum TaxID=3635 RepID=A0ABM2YHT2_GOSHI|nr:uncharacterized protein LOC121203728 [Gossypium hirsutum]